MGSALKIRDDLTPLELRRWARVESYGRAAARAYGIANALEEMPRADAARLAGMDRQTLRDAVVRYNALHDRPKGYSPRRLTADEEAALAAVIIAGPEPERRGLRLDPGRRALRQDLPPLEHDPGSTADGIFPPEGAPEPPAKGRRKRFKKGGFAEGDRPPPGRFRMKQQGRVCHRWWRRGECPRDASNRLPVGLQGGPPSANAPYTLGCGRSQRRALTYHEASRPRCRRTLPTSQDIDRVNPCGGFQTNPGRPKPKGTIEANDALTTSRPCAQRRRFGIDQRAGIRQPSLIDQNP